MSRLSSNKLPGTTRHNTLRQQAGHAHINININIHCSKLTKPPCAASPLARSAGLVGGGWCDPRDILHIGCVLFGDAAPSTGTQPGRFSIAASQKKKKNGLPAMKEFFCTMSRLPQYPVPFPVLSSALLCPTPCSAVDYAFLSRNELISTLPNALTFALSHAFLRCPAP